MQDLCTILLVLLRMFALGFSSRINIPPSNTSFDVMNYGAIGDGKTDDSQAFVTAWKVVCGVASNTSILNIPSTKTFLVGPAQFKGPCKSPYINIQVDGNIVAPNNISAWVGFHINSWLTFSNVNGLVINGRGQIDGQGFVWWSQPCQHNVVNCKGRPTGLIFNRCNDLQLNGLTYINSPRIHTILTNCNGSIISNLHISAPQTSPNTDGIDISGSTNIQVQNSYIGTGDDCIAISGGSSNINITGVTCGPGHGISIGALGHGGFDAVEEIYVQNCTFKGTTNGVRIKTWQGGNGYGRKISFEKINFEAVNNPIVIDQFYCPNRLNCQNQTSAITLSDISYTGIEGTSTTDKVINLRCSQIIGCTNIVLNEVNVTSTTPGRRTYANCFNAHGRSIHTNPAVNCLLP